MIETVPARMNSLPLVQRVLREWCHGQPARPSFPLIKPLRSLLPLMLASAAGVFWLAARRFWSGQPALYFLLWNLFLAWLPVVFAVVTSELLSSGQRTKWRSLGAMGSAVAWLLFLPNAPYLVTDLGHWRPRGSAPLWFDGLLLVHFAWLGLALGFAALRPMHHLVRRAWGRAAGWTFALAALGLASFGIYLGRFLRWNSWDVLADPTGLFGEISARIMDPTAHPRTWGFTLMFAQFLIVAYVTTELYGRQKLQAGRCAVASFPSPGKV